MIDSIQVMHQFFMWPADDTHRRLVAYYRRMGFVFEREVGDSGLADLPHLLVCGGVGTRMNGDVPVLLHRWSRVMRASKEWSPCFQDNLTNVTS